MSSPKPAQPQIRAYFTSLSPDGRKALRKLREAVHSAAPGAVEVFSYGIPGFRQKLNTKDAKDAKENIGDDKAHSSFVVVAT